MKKMLHENELINIEEDMILQPGYLLRRFTLNNRINGLKVTIINTGAAVRNVKLNDKDEIIRQIGGNNVIEWNPHVLGLDTLLLNANSNTMMYQLTTDNELIVVGKFRSQQQHLDNVTPFYFNLNPDSPTLDGHLLQVKAISEDPENDIEANQPVLAALTDQLYNLTGPEPCCLEYCDEWLKTSYDSVYSATGNSSTLCKVYLSYGSRSVEVSLKNNSSSANNNSDSHNVTCRLRLRLRKNGVSIMPHLMTEFQCVYRFIW